MLTKMSMFTKSLVFVNSAKCIPAVFSRLYSSEVPQLDTLAITVPKKHVYHVELNRPKQLNTITSAMWKELKICFDSLSDNPECRVVVLSARGKHFTAGIDLKSLLEESEKAEEFEDVARKARAYEKLIAHCQDGITALERCVKPVLVVSHSACVGAGIDLITAGDVRYCTQDAWFTVKEVDVGLAADVGTLQRLPKIIGNTSTVRELCFTARRFDSKEASELGLVSKVFADQESAIQNVLEIAETIASKSPVAVQNTKRTLVYSQSRPNEDGLEYIKIINQAMLQSEDLKKSAIAQVTKTTAEFDNL